MRRSFLRVSVGRRYPADSGAAGLLQDHDAADIWNVKSGLNDLGARRDGLFGAGVDVVHGDVRHPALGHAGIIRPADVENSADEFVAHFGDPIGAATRHRHWVEAPAQSFGIELLRSDDIARHQLVPMKFSVRFGHRELPAVVSAVAPGRMDRSRNLIRPYDKAANVAATTPDTAAMRRISRTCRARQSSRCDADRARPRRRIARG